MFFFFSISNPVFIAHERDGHSLSRFNPKNRKFLLLPFISHAYFPHKSVRNYTENIFWHHLPIYVTLSGCRIRDKPRADRNIKTSEHCQSMLGLQQKTLQGLQISKMKVLTNSQQTGNVHVNPVIKYNMEIFALEFLFSVVFSSCQIVWDCQTEGQM